VRRENVLGSARGIQHPKPNAEKATMMFATVALRISSPTISDPLKSERYVERRASQERAQQRK